MNPSDGPNGTKVQGSLFNESQLNAVNDTGALQPHVPAGTLEGDQYASMATEEAAMKQRFEAAVGTKTRSRVLKFASLGAVLVLGLVLLAIRLSHVSNTSSTTTADASLRYHNVSIPLAGLALNSPALSVVKTQTLSINGQLNVNNSLVLAPAAQPSTAVAGQLYFDQTSKQLSYYNGTAFVPLSQNTPAPPGVSSLGGSTGAVALGGGLAVNTGTLSNTGVLTLQGQAGNVTLAAGPGIVVSGTLLSNSGLLSLGGVNGNITLGSGLGITGHQVNNTGIISAVGTGMITVTNDGNGNITINDPGGGGGGTVSSLGGTVDKIAKFTGAQVIADSLISDNGAVVTVSGDLSVTGNVNFTNPLTVANGGTGANNAAGARSNLGAAKNGANSDITSLSGLTTALSVAQGGTGIGTLATNGVITGNGTSPLTSVVAGSAGQCLVSTAGAPIWSACPGASGVSSLNGGNGALTLNNASLAGSNITINDATTAAKGIASFNSTNFTVASGAVNTIQNINTTASPTFGQLTLTSSQAANPMFVVNNTNAAASGALLDLQLNGTSKFSVSPVGSITSSGTLNGQTISAAASFTGSVAVGTTLSVNTVTPTGALTVGATGQSFLLQGNASSTFTATNAANTTTLAFQTPTANVTYNFPTAAAGTYSICTTVGNCAGAGGGVTTPGGTANTVAKFTGSGTIGNSSITDNGSTVTIGATLSVNTITPTAALTVGATGQNLTLQGATVNMTSTASGITNSLTFATPSGSNKTITLPNASGTVAVSASGPIALDAAGNLTVGNAKADGSTKGVASFNGTNFQDNGGGVINTIQDIATTSAPTFGQLTLTSSQAANGMMVVNNTNAAGTGNLIDLKLNGTSKFSVAPSGNTTVAGSLAVNTITPSSSLTIGATSQSFTLQGSASSTITATGGGQVTTVGFTGSPTGAVIYNFDRAAAAGTYTICTTIGNCAGAGGGVTTPGGTANTVAKFTAGGTIGNSIITDNGTTVTVGGTLGVNTITPTGALTVGATGQNMTLQGATVSLTATSAGVTNSLTFATPSGSNKTVTIPNATGTVAVSASGPIVLDAAGNLTCPTCLTSGGSGGTAGVTSVDVLTGALTISNTTGSGTTITINNAKADGSTKGIATFNSTNFQDNGSGTINTIQDIASTSAPTFGQLTLTSSQAANAMMVVNNTNAAGTGNLIDLKLNGTSKFNVAPSGNTTIAGTLAVNTITPSSSLTVGATGQGFTIQGSASSTITATGGGQVTTVGFTGSPTGGVTYNFDRAAAAGTYTICSTVGNCAGTGGGVTTPGGTNNTVAKFTGSGTIGNSIITDNGSTVTVGGTLSVNTLTPTAALTVGATGQNMTLQGATVSLTATSGGITNSLTFAAPGTSNKTVTIPNASGTVAVSASGPIVLDAAGNLTCPTCLTTGGSGGTTGVTSVDGLTGVLTVSNTTGSGTTITINNAKADGSTKGIATFNSTNFQDNGSGVINTIQDISTAAAPSFGQLTVTSSQAANAMMVVNNTNAAATGNLIDLKLNGTSKFSVTPGGNTTIAGTLTVNTISPTGALTIGATGQNFTVQGNGSSTITSSANGHTTTVGFTGGSPTTDPTYQFNSSAATGTYSVCTTASVCAGYAVGSGSTNYIQNQAVTPQAASFYIQSANNGDITGVLRAKSGQTADIFQVQATGGGPLFQVSATANLSTFTDNVLIKGQDAVPAALVVQSNSSANNTNIIADFQRSDGTSVARIANDGGIYLGLVNSVPGAVHIATGTNTAFGAIDAPGLTGVHTVHLPNEDGTLCVENSTNCGFAIVSGSTAYIQNATSVQTSANFNIRSSLSTNVTATIQGTTGQSSDILDVQTYNGTTSTNVIQATANGSLVLSGSGTSTYTTPNGGTVQGRLVIANDDPGAFNALIYTGIPVGGNVDARVIAVGDGRASNHQPSIGVIAPNDQDVFGLTWDGSNTIATLKTNDRTSGGTDTVVIRSGNTGNGAAGNVAVDAGTSTTGSPTVSLGAVNATNVNIGHSGAAIGVTGSTFTVTGAASSLTGPSGGSSTVLTVGTNAASNVGVTLQGASSQTADYLQIQDSTGANILHVDSLANEESIGYFNNGIGGIGQFQNLLFYSEQLDNVSLGTNKWNQSYTNPGGVAIHPDDPAANPAPDAQTTGDLVSTVSGGNALGQVTATAVTSDKYTFSGWFKYSGGGTQFMQLRIDGSTTGTGTAKGFTATSTWQRFSVTQDTTGFTGNIAVVILPGGGGSGSVGAWGMQLVKGTTPQVYVRTTDSTIGANQGVVSNGAIWTNALNASDVPLVVMGAHSQTADLLRVENSSGSTLAKVDQNGNITAAGLTLGASPGSGSLLTNNGSTVNSTLALGDFATGGSIGTAASTVDVYTSISIAQLTPSQTITLPNPTASTAYGRMLYVSNIGTASFTISGFPLNAGATSTFIWSNTHGGAGWQYAGVDGAGILNQNASDQAANFRISGTGRANTSFTSPLIDSISGGLSVGTSTATGVTIGGTTNTTALLLQGAATATYTIGTSNNTGGITIGNSTASNTINIGNATIATGNTQTINVGTSATGTGINAVTIGSTNGASATTIQGGSGNINLTATGGVILASSDISFNNAAHNINFNVAGTTNGNSLNITGQAATSGNGGAIGITAGAGVGGGNFGGTVTVRGGNAAATGINGGVTIDSGSGSSSGNGTISIGTGVNSNIINTGTVNIGATATGSNQTVGIQGNAINIGVSGALAQTVTIGSSNNASNGVSIESGGSGIAIGNASSASHTILIGANSNGTTIQTVTVGNNSNVNSTTAIQGGNGSTAITLTPNAAGAIVIGASAGTGQITLGSSSAAQTIAIANGFGAPTVTIANNATTGGTVSIQGANTATGNTDTLNLATGTTAGTGAKVVHIADGTPGGTGNNTVTIGSLGNASSTTLQAGTGNINLTTNQASAGTIVKTATNNSATAFQVQNAASAAILTVDTTKNRVSANGGLYVTDPTLPRQFSLRVDSSTGIFKLTSNSVGQTTPGNATDSGNHDMISTSKYNSGPGGTVSSLYFYSTNANGTTDKIEMAIYADSGGSPASQSRLGSTSLSGTVLNAGPSWTKVALTSSVTLAPNTTYWLAFNVNNGGIVYGAQNGAGGDSQYAGPSGTYAFGASGLPATFPASLMAPGGMDYSIYATYDTVNDQTKSGAAFTIDDNNSVTFRPRYNMDDGSNSGSATFQVQNASGGSVLSVDTISGFVGVNGLQVFGVDTTYNVYVQGVGSSGTAGIYRSNATTTDTIMNFLSDVGNTKTVQLAVKNNGDLTFGNTGNHTISASQSSSGAGKNITIAAGQGASGQVGGNLVLQAGANGTASGTPGSVIIKANGGDSTTAFQIQSANGTSILTTDTSTMTVTLGTSGSGNTVSFTAAGGLVAAGTARHTKTILLTPEYAGGVLDAQNDASCSSAFSGTMTSGYDLTNRMNYYNWTAALGSAQCYDVVAQIPIPSDFSAWSGNPDIEMEKDSTGTAAYALQITPSSGSDANYGAFAVGNTITTSWSNMANNPLSGTYTAGNYMTIRIRMTSTSGANVKLGNIKLQYLSAF